MSSKTVLWPAFAELTGDSPWLGPLLRYYTVLSHKDGRHVAIFQSGSRAVAFEGGVGELKQASAVDEEFQWGCLTLFRHYWDVEGFQSSGASLDSLASLESCFSQMGLTSAQVMRITRPATVSRTRIHWANPIP